MGCCQGGRSTRSHGERRAADARRGPSLNDLCCGHRYTAPEVLKGVPYSPVVDLWSLGVVGYLVLTGARRPFV